MENYTNSQPTGIEREKSVYLVHLDNVRIVILASMLIGVVAVSFLIGMHLSGSASDDIYSDAAIRTPSLAIADATAAAEDPLAKDTAAAAQVPGESQISANDLLATVANTPAPAVAQSAPVANRTVDAVVPKASTAPKPAAAPRVAKTEKKEVVEKPKTVAASAPAPSVESVKPGYSVQIASFDSRDKAMVEVSRLQRLSYQPYIDRADVKGKTYFRVKVGPLVSKSAAIETMNELQATEKYKDSFIVYQK